MTISHVYSLTGPYIILKKIIFKLIILNFNLYERDLIVIQIYQI